MLLDTAEYINNIVSVLLVSIIVINAWLTTVCITCVH